MFGFDKTVHRRIRREGCPAERTFAARMRRKGGIGAVMIALGFWAGLVALLLQKSDVVAWRPGQFVPYDITARVEFQYADQDALERRREFQRESAPHVYRQQAGNVWDDLQTELLNLPETVHGQKPEELEEPYKSNLDAAALTELEQCRTGPARETYEDNVRQFISYAQEHLNEPNPLVVLDQSDWEQETRGAPDGTHRTIVLRPAAVDPTKPQQKTPPMTERTVEAATATVGATLPDWVLQRLRDYAKGFDLGLGPRVAALAAAKMSANPNFVLDQSATTNMQNSYAKQVDPKDAIEIIPQYTPIVHGGVLSESGWQKLRAENQAYFASLTSSRTSLLQYYGGVCGIAAIITLLLVGYIVKYQPRAARNHARGLALAGLLLSMLLLSELAGIGSSSLILFAVAPTMLTAMILTIAYEQRFAMGVATIHTLAVTTALDQGLGFFLILWVGALSACYTLDDIRTRSKLIEVGGLSAFAIIAVTAALGAWQMEPMNYVVTNCLYAGLAAFIAGFVVLGILPFIERAFRITTSMTLLELADVSQPLLRRLALEAAGTYNHSLQVATLAEAAAEAISANSLLCRVGSYYHDIGKLHKPDYFVENQLGGENRHLNLSPSLSLRIILAHVKDGVELAKEYNLPTSILPIVQQHHGTTLVEYFYHQAMTQTEPEAGPKLSDTEFRYPGPKPRSREAAIVMLCDAVESAARSMSEPTASRIESLVHDLALKRLHDGQFDDSELSTRDLSTIEQAIRKALVGVYHGRIAYPSNPVTPSATQSAESPAVKSA